MVGRVTVPIFPVNPHGGKVDIASHLEGRVRNVDVIVRFVSYLIFFFTYLWVIESFIGTITSQIKLRGTRQSLSHRPSNFDVH